MQVKFLFNKKLSFLTQIFNYQSQPEIGEMVLRSPENLSRNCVLHYNIENTVFLPIWFDSSQKDTFFVQNCFLENRGAPSLLSAEAYIYYITLHSYNIADIR